MKIAYIDKKNATLQIKNRILRVDDQQIPLRLIDTLVLASSSQIQSRDMVKLTAEGITILMLAGRSRDIAIIHSATSPNAQLRLAQYHATSRSLDIAKYLITQKIKLHAIQLKHHDITVETDEAIEQIDRADTIDSILGIEGSFSRLYFSNYF